MGSRGSGALDVAMTRSDLRGAEDDYAMQLIRESRRLRNVGPLAPLPQTSAGDSGHFLPGHWRADDDQSGEHLSIYSSGHSNVVTEVPIVPVPPVPPQPKTPKGSPPQSGLLASAGRDSPGPLHYEEVLQDVRNAPPAESTSAIRVRGPRGYAWETDTEVATKYTPKQDTSTPRAPLKPWEPPPIPDLPLPNDGARAGVAAVGTERKGCGVRGEVSLVAHVPAELEAVRETAQVQDRRFRFNGLFGVFHLEGESYVTSAVLRGGQLSRMVEPGDKLVSIDGQKVDGLGPDQVRHLFDGEVGSPMKLDFVRAAVFSVTIFRTDSEMADIQASTSQYLLSFLEADGVERAHEVHLDDGEHLRVAVRRLTDTIRQKQEDMQSMVKVMEEKIKQQAIQMNRTQDSIKADAKQTVDEMTASVKALEAKLQEAEKAKEDETKAIREAANDQVRQAEEKANADKAQMQNLLDIRKEKAELEMKELRKVADDHQRIIDMQVAQNKEYFEEKVRLIEIENTEKLDRELESRVHEMREQMREQSDATRNVEMAAKLEEEKARHEEVLLEMAAKLEEEKAQHKEVLLEMAAKLEEEKVRHEEVLQVQSKLYREELQEQQQQVDKKILLQEMVLQRQMESQIQKMRLDFERHFTGVSINDASGSIRGTHGIGGAEDEPDQSVTELVGFLRAEFAKMREAAQREMEAKLAAQQKEFQVRVREHEERLTHEQRQKGEEVEALQRKYSQAHEEQVRVHRQAGEEKLKSQDARFEQMMAELRSGHQLRIENMEHGYEEILVTLRSEIDEMRAQAQARGEEEMALHTTIARLRSDLEEASSQHAQDFERLGLRHKEEVCERRRQCVGVDCMKSSTALISTLKLGPR